MYRATRARGRTRASSQQVDVLKAACQDKLETPLKYFATLQKRWAEFAEIQASGRQARRGPPCLTHPARAACRPVRRAHAPLQPSAPPGGVRLAAAVPLRLHPSRPLGFSRPAPYISQSMSISKLEEIAATTDMQHLPSAQLVSDKALAWADKMLKADDA